jgi:hypothetical protein
MPGAGASSMTFWCRRCIEQSRSNRIHGIPEAVGKHLDLDMAWILEKFFQVDDPVVECRLRLGPRQADGIEQRRLGVDDRACHGRHHLRQP